VEIAKVAKDNSNSSTKATLEVCTKGLSQGNFKLDPDITVDIPLDQYDSACNVYQQETLLGYLQC